MHTHNIIEQSSPIFEPAGFVMIRSPLLPVDTLRRWLDVPSSIPSTASVLTVAPSEHESASAKDEHLLRDRLYDIISDPKIQEAILVSSPDLFDAMSHWRHAPDSKKGRHAQANILRYLIRMASRPTPFGLFAGVAFGTIGPNMNICIGACTRNLKRTRPDMEWLLYLVREIEQRPSVTAHVRFFTNSMAFVSNGRLHLPYLDLYGQAGAEKTASVRATPAVMATLAWACHGATLDALAQQLLIDRPAATEDQARGLVDGLRQQGALLSELRPPMTGGDAARYVLRKIEHLPDSDDVREQIQTVVDLAEAYDSHPIGMGIETFRALQKATNLSDSKIRSTLEVDMATAVDNQIFSASVAKQVAKAAEVILRVSVAPPELRHLAIYRSEFIERYGERREVPLLELLDDDIGLGPPPTYKHPSRVSEPPGLRPPHEPKRGRALSELVALALRDQKLEVDLDEATLTRLQVNDAWRDSIPDSLELYISIVASSQADINNDDYKIVIGPRTGASPAGRSFGRFCDILGPASTEALTDLAREEESSYPERVIAELVYLPPIGHAANVAIRPAIRNYEVVIATSPSVDHDYVVPVDDLVVGVQGNRFYIRSLARNAELIVRNTHLLTEVVAPNACRFLTDVSDEGVGPIHPFDWGAVSESPFLPRLRVGKIVLSPAQWHLSTETGTMREPEWQLMQWCEYLRAWRCKWSVPRYVYLVQVDHRLLLDLENPLCMTDLGEQCRKGARGKEIITLQEVIPALDDAWTGGVDGNYLLEFVVPLKRRELIKHPAIELPKLETVEPSERLHMLGSNWLYSKLYTGRNLHDDLIAGPVREFANEMLATGLASRWFFIRYGDPDSHIRLRFEGEPSVLLSQLLPLLTAWGRSLIDLGFVRNLAFDSYDREIERYGGLEGMRIAESIFSADSVAVSSVIALQSRQVLELSSVDVAVLMIDHLLSTLGVDRAERLTLYRAARRAQEKTFGGHLDQLRKVFHSYRKTTQRLVGDDAWLRTEPGGNNLAECLDQRSEALRPLGEQLRTLAQRNELWRPRLSLLAAYVHMSCNRLLGVDRTLEFEAMYYLERTLESLERHVPADLQIG